jgi:uncharacterized 2Fe-2S/4Fe-4S cluster protein (DUF4445 family)
VPSGNFRDLPSEFGNPQRFSNPGNHLMKSASSSGQPTAGWVHDLSLAPPSLADNTADGERLAMVLKQRTGAGFIQIDPPLLERLPNRLREHGFRVRCTLFRQGRNWILVEAGPVDPPNPPLGAAIDLGTSRVAVRLLDLVSRTPVAEAGFDNPQIGVAPDILGRIHYTDQPKGLARLNELIVAGINRQLQAMVAALDRKLSDLHLAVLAGNTTMTHLFMGLSPHWMIREPYIPVTNRPGVIAATQLGLSLHPAARILVFPNAGSYFGGDLIAGILFAGLHRRTHPAILVDVGTNAEVVLGNRDWLMACAGAAGPALEGGVTRMGMMAGQGVIDAVSIDAENNRWLLHTIGEVPPRGICGSGVIDLAAALFASKMLDIRGKLVPERCQGRLRTLDGMHHLVIVPADATASGQELTISQADLDSLIRSKAAMYTILETITAAVGVTFEELDPFYVAGTFGSFIRPDAAVTIGMIPDLPRQRFKTLGNSSLEGATKILLDPAAFDEIDAIRDRVTYMELNVNQDFMNRFSAAKFLPHTDGARFPSVV